MRTQKLTLNDFEETYESTYDSVLKFFIFNALDINDINDLIQDTYVELYKLLKRKRSIVIDNIKSYIIGIAKNKLKHHYTLTKLRQARYVDPEIYEAQEKDIEADIDIEHEIMAKEDAKLVWEYIKTKDMKVVKVFYMYYIQDFKISSIAKALNITESNVKNMLYRTIKEIKQKISSKGDKNV